VVLQALNGGILPQPGQDGLELRFGQVPLGLPAPSGPAEFPIQGLAHYLEWARVEGDQAADTGEELLQLADPQVGGVEVHLLKEMVLEHLDPGRGDLQGVQPAGEGVELLHRGEVGAVGVIGERLAAEEDPLEVLEAVDRDEDGLGPLEPLGKVSASYMFPAVDPVIRVTVSGM